MQIGVSFLLSGFNMSFSVYLFTTDNYHWYRKRTINLADLEPISIFWSLDKFHLISKNGSHSVYDWYSQVDRTTVANYTGVDRSFKLPHLVAVIDGGFFYCLQIIFIDPIHTI